MSAPRHRASPKLRVVLIALPLSFLAILLLIRSWEFSTITAAAVSATLIAVVAGEAARTSDPGTHLLPLWVCAAASNLFPPLAMVLGGSRFLSAEVGMPLLLVVSWGTIGVASGRTIARQYARRNAGSQGLPLAIIAVLGALGGVAIPLGAADRVAADLHLWATLNYVTCDGSRAPYDGAASVTVTVDDRYPQALRIKDGRVDYVLPYYWRSYSMDLQMANDGVVRLESWQQRPEYLYPDMLLRIWSLGLMKSGADEVQEGGWELRQNGC